MTGPGAAETAASFIGSEVSESHERKSTKFLLRHSGVSSAVKELPIRSSPQRVPLYLSPSSSASVVVTLGCRQLQRSCHFARPQTESVSVSVCFRLRLPPSSSVSVEVPGGWSRGRRVSVRYSTSRVWKPPWRACSKFVRYSVTCET